MINFFIGLSIGILIGILFSTWILKWCPLAKSIEKEKENFRQRYIEENKNAVKYFNENVKLKGLLRDAFNLIEVEYTFRRHSDIWIKFKGIETRDRLKNWIKKESS